MASKKCVVEGCNLEYDVVCSFSFYNVNTLAEGENGRQDWIEGAMQPDSECLWRHVSLQLCGYHFELDSQGLWIDSPMMPELLTVKQLEPTPEQIVLCKNVSKCTEIDSFQGLFERFIGNPRLEYIRKEHNYTLETKEEENADSQAAANRLNVRQLVDTLGYLSMKSLQRKQLWVVKVETDKVEASITQSEQVITKMTDTKQIIEIVPTIPTPETTIPPESLEITEETTVPDDFIYEIAVEQEITMDEVKETPREWTVNVVTERPKYAYIKHCNTGKKKRHFTSEMSHITFHGDFENYYILPDEDPSSCVEVTTSYEPENYIVDEYQHLVLQPERPKKKRDAKKRKKMTMKEQVKQIKTEIADDWVIESNVLSAVQYEQDSDDDSKRGTVRVRRKNKKYLGYDFVT